MRVVVRGTEIVAIGPGLEASAGEVVVDIPDVGVSGTMRVEGSYLVLPPAPPEMETSALAATAERVGGIAAVALILERDDPETAAMLRARVAEEMRRARERILREEVRIPLPKPKDVTA